MRFRFVKNHFVPLPGPPPLGKYGGGSGKKKWSRLSGTTRILKYEPTYYKLRE